MRIISGKYRGHKFHPPKNIPTRPTTDIAKEALFNVLGGYFNFENISYLDLFAGTGSLSYEYASRGCTDITSVDRNRNCVRFMNQMVEDWNIEGMVIEQMDVFKFIEGCRRSFDLIFAGPPYPMKEQDKLPDMIFEHGLLTEVGWFILEHSPAFDFTKHPKFFDVRNYGQTHFAFFAHSNPL